MSLARYAAKRDCNEQPIIDEFERLGAVVQQLSSRDVPDLLVGFLGTTHLVEVKWENAQLTPGQATWHKRWAKSGERPEVVRSPAHARKCIVIWTREFAERQRLKALAPEEG